MGKWQFNHGGDKRLYIEPHEFFSIILNPQMDFSHTLKHKLTVFQKKNLITKFFFFWVNTTANYRNIINEKLDGDDKQSPINIHNVLALCNN